jgi:PAS domain S-box-containing protein
MGQDRRTSREKTELRLKAEARLKGRVPEVQEMSVEQLRQLVYELSVHQIELEMQNEELRGSQALLAEATSKYSDFFDFAPVGYLALSQAGLIKEANLTACSQLGLSRDRLLERPLRFFIKGDDLEIFHQFLQRVMEEAVPRACELRLKRKGGDGFYARLDGIVGKNLKGETECRTAVTDISEFKRVERQLRESQTRFTSFMGHLPSEAVIRDLEGRYLYVNPTAEKTLGRPREEWWGRTTEEMWPREVAEKFRAQDRLVVQSGKPMRVLDTLPQPDGLHHWMYDVFPIVNDQGETVMIGVSALDVTDYVDAKEALERLLAYGPAAFYTCELGGALAPTTYLSDNIRALVGWEAQDFLKDPGFWLEHIHPEDRPAVLKVMDTAWPDDHQVSEYRFQAADGTYHWVHDECKLLRDEDGKPLEISGVWIDITQRKQAEQELERTHHQMQALIQAAPLAIIAADREGRITGWNPAAERIFGWSAAEAMGRLNPIVPADKQSEFRHILEQQLAGKPVPAQELRRQRRDGSLIDISLCTAPLYNLQGEIAGGVGVIEDITEEKKVREALRES